MQRRTPTNKPAAPLPRLPYINKFILKDPAASPFLGPPRPELDEAWHALLDPTALRFTDVEFARAGNITSVRHKSGGYVGGMGFVHNLHCLVCCPNTRRRLHIELTHPSAQKRIKQFLHPDYYYGNLGRDDKAWHSLYMHVDHCLEALRQAAMCTPDLNIFTLAWQSGRRKPDVDFPQAHACVDWSALSAWTKSRATTYMDVVSSGN